MTESSFILMAEQFAEKTREKRDLEAQLADVKKELADLERHIVAVHELSGIGSSVKLAEGGTLIVSEKTDAKKTDTDALIRWFDRHNMSEMAPRTVNANSLGALVRERLENEEAIPEGCEVRRYKKVSWKK